MKRLILLTIILLVTAVPALPSSAFADGQLTRLRIVGSPNGTFKNSYGTTYVTNVSVKIKNVGSVDAEDIDVNATLPGGEFLQLSGPSTLGRNKTASFGAKTYTLVTTTKKIKAKVNCSNCR